MLAYQFQCYHTVDEKLHNCTLYINVYDKDIWVNLYDKHIGMVVLNESIEPIFGTINPIQWVSLFDVAHRLSVCGHPAGIHMDNGPQSNIVPSALHTSI